MIPTMNATQIPRTLWRVAILEIDRDQLPALPVIHNEWVTRALSATTYSEAKDVGGPSVQALAFIGDRFLSDAIPDILAAKYPYLQRSEVSFG